LSVLLMTTSLIRMPFASPPIPRICDGRANSPQESCPREELRGCIDGSRAGSHGSRLFFAPSQKASLRRRVVQVIACQCFMKFLLMACLCSAPSPLANLGYPGRVKHDHCGGSRPGFQKRRPL
jgi:hypothetical protein